MTELQIALDDFSAYVPGPFGLLQPVTNRQVFPENNLSDGSVQTLTYRSAHVFQEDCPFVVVAWVNSAEPFATQADTVTYTAAYDHVIGSPGNLNSVPVVRIRFRGAESIDVVPEGIAVSDPIFGPFKKGERILIRTCVSVGTLGDKWPRGMTLNWSFEGTAAGDATLTPNFSISFSAAGAGVSPFAILGPVSQRPAVIGAGDSIMDGAGDSGAGPYANLGFLTRALEGQYGHSKVSGAGRKASDEVAFGAFKARGVASMLAKNIVSNYGTNDIGGGASLATVQIDLIKLWKFWDNTGRRVWQATIIPRTTSSDSWATTANQTVMSGESVRTGLNDWLRAGAPIVAGAAVAIGTSGAALAGEDTHPLYNVFDIAALVEVNSSNVLTLNGGRWIVTGAANYPTTDGIHPSAAATALMVPAIDLTQFAA